MANRDHIHAPADQGARLADAVAEGMGSWRFIIIQSAIVALWILLNLVAVALRWDPYPFILLNLLFSTQAAYAAPVIMMSQNRQAAKDRIRDDTEAAEVDELFKINQTQLAILQQQSAILALLTPPVPMPPPADPAPAPKRSHKKKVPDATSTPPALAR